MLQKASFACCFRVSGEQEQKACSIPIDLHWYTQLQPAKHSSEREKKNTAGVCFPATENYATRSLIGIVGIVDVNLAVHASIGGLRVWLLFCRGALASLFLSLSLSSRSRSSSPERRGTSGITAAAKPLLPAFYLMITYMCMWVRDASWIRARMAWIERESSTNIHCQ